MSHLKPFSSSVLLTLMYLVSCTVTAHVAAPWRLVYINFVNEGNVDIHNMSYLYLYPVTNPVSVTLLTSLTMSYYSSYTPFIYFEDQDDLNEFTLK